MSWLVKFAMGHPVHPMSMNKDRFRNTIASVAFVDT